MKRYLVQIVCDVEVRAKSKKAAEKQIFSGEGLVDAFTTVGRRHRVSKVERMDPPFSETIVKKQLDSHHLRLVD